MNGVDDPDCGGKPATVALPALSLRRLMPAGAAMLLRRDPAAGVRSPDGDQKPSSAAKGLRKEPELRADERPIEGLARPSPRIVTSSDLRLSLRADAEDSLPGPVTAPVNLLCEPSDRARGGCGLSTLCRLASRGDAAAAEPVVCPAPVLLLPRPAIAITMARAAFAAWYCRAAASMLAYSAASSASSCTVASRAGVSSPCAATTMHLLCSCWAWPQRRREAEWAWSSSMPCPELLYASDQDVKHTIDV